MKGQTFRSCTIVFATCMLLMGSVAPAWSQGSSDFFLVRDVVIEAEYNPRFIRRIAEMGISWDRATNASDVECVAEQLLNTRLFKSVESRFFELKDSGGHQLILSLEFRYSQPVYKIGNVDVVGVAGVDTAKFQEHLRLDSVSEQLIPLDAEGYATFEDRLFEILKESIADEEQRDWKRTPWLEIKLSNDKLLDITVSSTSKGCS